MTDEKEKEPHLITPHDVWISSTLIGVILSVLGGVVTIKDTLTKGAVEEEARFIRLEESVKSLKEKCDRWETRK